jgi:hypothetical protein
MFALMGVADAFGDLLLPAIDAIAPKVAAFSAWAAKNPDLMKKISIAFVGFTAAVIALNIALSLNPFVLMAIGIGALIGLIAAAYFRFNGFRKVVDTVFNAMKIGVALAIDNFRMLLNVVKGIFNGIGSAWNNTFGKISFKIPNIPGLPGRGTEVKFPKIPALEDGGIVTGPTLALIGEAGPEAVIPLDRAGGMGGNNVTINVQGADPNAVVDALRTYMFRNGSVPIRVS